MLSVFRSFTCPQLFWVLNAKTTLGVFPWKSISRDKGAKAGNAHRRSKPKVPVANACLPLRRSTRSGGSSVPGLLSEDVLESGTFPLQNVEGTSKVSKQHTLSTEEEIDFQTDEAAKASHFFQYTIGEIPPSSESNLPKECEDSDQVDISAIPHCANKVRQIALLSLYLRISLHLLSRP